MNSPRVSRLVLPVLAFAVSAGSAVAQQQAAWGPSQQSMYHNHPGTSPTYTSYGKDTPTVSGSALPSTPAPSPAKPSSAAPASAKRVSAHPAGSTIKTRRSE